MNGNNGSDAFGAFDEWFDARCATAPGPDSSGKWRAALPSVGPRFTLGDRLGRGGMGFIWNGRDEHIGRAVAVKTLALDGDVAHVRRFLREAKVQALVDHPVMVPVYDAGVTEAGVPWFAMKRVEGETLADVIDELREGGERVRLHELLAAFVRICPAIDFAHGCDVVHRDLKPANIMLGRSGEVYVLDWGIAQCDGELDLDLSEEPGMVLGTAGYMPPEQARGHVVGPASDVYGLGAILFEILTLEPAHDGRTPMARLAQTVGPGDLRPSSRAPQRSVPPELDEVCLSALAFDPRARIHSSA